MIVVKIKLIFYEFFPFMIFKSKLSADCRIEIETKDVKAKKVFIVNLKTNQMLKYTLNCNSKRR